MRSFKRLTQNDVARRIGLSRAALSAIETGKRRVDSLELLALARIYGYPTGFLLGEPTEYGGSFFVDEALIHLDEAEREELRRFASYLKARRTAGAEP
jgi:transcriptional regulator with XRE-family HTH domain